MKYIDLPPVWTLLTLAGMFILDRILPLITFDTAWLDWLGYGLIAAGVALMVWSAIQFLLRKTTIFPVRTPSALIDHGPYGFSRNPIYLADVGIACGFALILGSLTPLIGPPILAMVLTRRFILPEENLAHHAFGEEFAQYTSRVRRWL